MAQAPPRDTQGHHEKDERWTAVDQYARHHLFSTNTPENAGLQAKLQYAYDLSANEGLPNIEVSALQGGFLRLQCLMLNAKNVLEVGTLGGYSSIWLASTSPETKVTTIEVNAKHRDVAIKAHKNAGLENQIECLLGPGGEVMPQIRKDIEAGKREKFDFVFIDADKQNNLNYLNEAVLMCRPRGLIIVDNVARRGYLADAEVAKTDDRVAGSRAVVEGAGKDSRLDCSLLQTVGEKNYDGFLLCVVK